MQIGNVEHHFLKIIEMNVPKEQVKWLEDKIRGVVNEKSSRELFLTYSLIATKIKIKDNLEVSIDDIVLEAYLLTQNTNIQQIGRIYLLICVLNADNDFFAAKVATIIQIADTSELETFLKFLILLPRAEYYKHVAVDALRTNIATVFNALAYNNPYPGRYFNDQEWNQMFLKTAFMEADLSAISDVDKRANKDLARIISDYAHERWAASRNIDPFFWRPVSKFMNDELLKDMHYLLNSDVVYDTRAAALCLYTSDNIKAKALLEEYPELQTKVEQKNISWDSLKI